MERDKIRGVQSRTQTKKEVHLSDQTHLTMKDVDGVETVEQLEALMAERGIKQLSPNAELRLRRKGVLKEPVATE